MDHRRFDIVESIRIMSEEFEEIFGVHKDIHVDCAAGDGGVFVLGRIREENTCKI